MMKWISRKLKSYFNVTNRAIQYIDKSPAFHRPQRNKKTLELIAQREKINNLWYKENDSETLDLIQKIKTFAISAETLNKNKIVNVDVNHENPAKVPDGRLSVIMLADLLNDFKKEYPNVDFEVFLYTL
ncbi:uncharacterized protein LOC118761587 [Octopus sinensis]|uniref:Uncharacterized protein LOC118761587 n=1 Tax=Octopus sinensis TaxID=2607531 RepID=A0A7E6EIU8_9MOLL|nr:uncharacterized protein LOC118761587 [Octopus sinensis]